MLRWDCTEGILFHCDVVFVVARQPVIVLSALLCWVCSCYFAFERVEDQAGEARFKVEQMNCM